MNLDAVSIRRLPTQALHIKDRINCNFKKININATTFNPLKDGCIISPSVDCTNLLFRGYYVNCQSP